MKFNTTYIPSMNIHETLLEISNVKQSIKEYLHSRFKLLDVSSPIVLEKGDERLVGLYTITRPITFDLARERKIADVVISPSNWLRDLIDRIDLPDKHGVITETKSIFRDLQETPNNTAVKDEIIVQLRINNPDRIEQICKSLAGEFYEFIFNLAKEYETKNKIRNIFKKDITFISSQFLGNTIPHANHKEREINYSLDHSSYFLTQPGLVMFSGHIHTNIPPEIYDLRNFYQLVLADSINTSVTKPLFVSVLSNGVQLKDQLRMNELDHFNQNSFYQGLMEQKYKVIELRINVPRLLMSILQKGHIAELQPGVISEESTTIAARNKIEKL